jgi:hypothetical protein
VAERAPKPDDDNRPVQDEWGLFDPERAGFAAVFRRLREHAERLKTGNSTPPPASDSRKDRSPR